MRAKFVFEKFTEDSDPISDMGIGMLAQIKDWIKSLKEKGSIWRMSDMNNTEDLLDLCISNEAKDEFIEYLLNSRNDYNKSEILNRLISNERLKLAENLIKRGVKINDFENKVNYISRLHGKLLSFTPEEELIIACKNGDFNWFLKLINSGVKLKIGMINSLFKLDYFYAVSRKNEKDKILQFLRDNINDLKNYVHPRDHKKLDKIKQYLSSNQSQKWQSYPPGYKMYRVLKYVDENKVSTRKELVKLIYELSYGKNTFNPLLHGGYWSDSFNNVYSNLYTDSDGNFALNPQGKTKLKKYDDKFKNMKIVPKPYV